METVEPQRNTQQLIRQVITLNITKSPSGNKLNKPIEIKVAKPNGLGEKAVQKYIIDSLSWKMPALIDFALNNKSVNEIAKHLYRHATGSSATLYQYTYGVYRFSKWIGETPDSLIQKSQNGASTLAQMTDAMDDFVGDLKATGIAPGTISNYVKGVKALFRINGIQLKLPYKLKRRVRYKDRAPTPEELTRIIDLADLREKVIVSLLALGGFRVGTLVKLQYRHAQNDLEQGKTPLQLHVEAEITKGKYADYDTFVGSKAVEYLKAYLEMRRKGTRNIPPETINPQSPLIRAEHAKTVKPLTTSSIHSIVHNLYVKSGIIKSKKRRYELRPHSLRKYFRTQLGSLNTIPTDYIEYMMGHVMNTYNDVQMKGIAFLRNLYAQSGFSIRPKSKVSKIDQLNVIMEAWGLDPNKILSREALSAPHRTVVDNRNEQIRVLNQSLKSAIIKELQQTQQGIFE